MVINKYANYWVLISSDHGDGLTEFARMADLWLQTMQQSYISIKSYDKHDHPHNVFIVGQLMQKYLSLKGRQFIWFKSM